MAKVGSQLGEVEIPFSSANTDISMDLIKTNFCISITKNFGFIFSQLLFFVKGYGCSQRLKMNVWLENDIHTNVVANSFPTKLLVFSAQL